MLKSNEIKSESSFEETSGTSADEAGAVLAESVAPKVSSRPLKGVDSVERDAVPNLREKSLKAGGERRSYAVRPRYSMTKAGPDRSIPKWRDEH